MKEAQLSFLRTVVGVSLVLSSPTCSAFLLRHSTAPTSDPLQLRTSTAHTFLRIKPNNGSKTAVESFFPLSDSDSNSINDLPSLDPVSHSANALILASIFLASSPVAAAAADGSASPIASAFAAYAHYGSLFVFVAALTVERVIIGRGAGNISQSDEELMTGADIVYGIAAVLVTVSGYLRVTQYGKGWDFYQHEPIFWLKLTLVGILGAISFFPTVILTKRSIAFRNGEPYEELSPKLVKRMTTIMNAEVSALLSIPLSATLMSRGVGYWEDFPWPVGAGFVVLALFGLGYNYVKEALTWEDTDKVVDVESD